MGEKTSHNEHSKQSDTKIQFLWFDLSVLPRNAQFVSLVVITFVFFLLYGYMQELLYRLPGFSNYSWYLTLIQFLFYSLFAWLEMKIRNEKRRIPMKDYVVLAFLTVATMGLSNAAVAHLNYPTQVMFKCCKLIPVMVGGILIQGKRYNVYDVSASVMMSIGLIFFTLADVQVQPTFEVLGVVLISGALVADALIGNVQEKQMKAYKASNVEVVLYSYAIGSLYVFVGELLFDRIGDAVAFWSEHPVETYGYTFIFSVTGYMGINIVLQLVKHFGALLAVTVTTCRKAVTIALSFVFFAKPFTLHMLGSKPEVVKCLFFDLTRMPRAVQFVLLSATIFAFHLVQGYMHELIFKLPGFKPFSMYLTLLQFVIYSVLAYAETVLSRCIASSKGSSTNRRRKVSLRTYSFIAFLTVATLGLSNTAVAYLNFPTFNMFKSCKLIPVMIGSMIILKKKYNHIDKLAVLCMVVGLIFFTMADTKLHPNFEFFGVSLVMGALVADAVIGNYQEKAMKQFDSTNTEMVLFSYSIGAFYILLWELLVSQRLFEAYEFCSQHPQETYGRILLYSTVGYFGLNVVLTLVKEFGALIAVTVTTCRKAITIVLSFILFSKPFTFQYFWSGLIVLLGIYLNLYSKNPKSWNQAFYRIYTKLMRAVKLSRQNHYQTEYKYSVL